VPWSREHRLVLLLSLAGGALLPAQQALASGPAVGQGAGLPRSAFAQLFDAAGWLPPRARDTIARIVLAEAIEPPTLTISESDLFASRDRLFGVQPRAATQAIGLNLERDLFGIAAPAAPPLSQPHAPGPGASLLTEDWAAGGP